MPAGPIVNAFTVDVEEYYHASALSNAVAPDARETLPSSVERCTDAMLAILDERGYHGTFFVLGMVAQRHPDLVRRIAAAGHEIASHGYSHRLVYTQSRDEFEEETRRAKDLLEDLTGNAVLGYRAATFSLTDDVPWAHDVLIDCGFAYDSSVFPIRHDRYGNPGAPRFPYRIEHTDGTSSLVEFPMSTMTWAGLRVPVAGGGYFRLLPQQLSRYGLRRINEKDGQPFVFYSHPWEIDPQQPRFDLGWLSNKRHYSNLDRCEDWLRDLVAEFRFGTCAEVLSALGHDLERDEAPPLRQGAAG